MIMTLSLSDFRTEWARSDRKNSFSYEGLEVLFDFLEETHPNYDLDIVELDSAYTEATPEEIAKDYSYTLDIDGLDDEELFKTVLEFLENKTTVAGITEQGTILYMEF
jgi:hypothetical protein